MPSNPITTRQPGHSVGGAVSRRNVPRRIAVVGGGAWGTTLAALASASGPATLWAREAEVVQTITDARVNELFLPGVDLPPGMGVTRDLEEALTGADIVVVAVPAQHVRSVAQLAHRFIAPDALVVSATKGIEPGPASA